MNFMNIGITVKTTLTDFNWKKESLPKKYKRKYFLISLTLLLEHIYFFTAMGILYIAICSH